MKNRVFTGAATAIITPLNEKGIDYERFARLIDWQIESGIDAIVTVGTTGEGSTLTDEEHKEAIRFTVERVAGRVPVIAGTGSNDIAYAISLTEYACEVGADAMLLVTPYYNKPSQEGLYQHFKRVSEASPLPIILYNIPGRSGVNMLPATTKRIAEDMPNVIGIKEASGKIEQIEEVIRDRKEGFLVLSGDDGMAVDVMRRGGEGVISVAANLFPVQFGKCMKLAAVGEFEKADEVYAPYDEVVQALFVEGNPTGIKCALKAKGLIGGTMRLPLVEGTKALHDKFSNFIEKYDLH
jgi:4-hydroxy-tetrahydrodipicolinate synthase